MSLYSEARKIARRFGSPEEAAENMGITIIKIPFKSIKGAALSLGETKIIFVDSGLSYLERQIIIGHELGHFCLHPSTNFLFVQQKTLLHGKHEYQANRFVCELMLGEKAEEHKHAIAEVCAKHRLDKLAEFISSVLRDEI